MHRLSRRLLERSQEAYLLALDVYNRPTIRYRVEGFCFLFTNAWELLLKAKIVEDTKKDRSIFCRKKRRKPRRSISLKDALKKVFPKENDPIRRNIEEIAALRDCAIHLLIPELEFVYGGMFQSGVMNYANKLREWFGLSLTDRASPSMLSLVFDVKEIDPVAIQKRYGKEVLQFIIAKSKSVEDAIATMNDLSFGIPITYRLVLTSKPKDADIIMSLEEEGGPVARFIEVPKDISRTHPYRFRQLLARISARLGEPYIVNQHDLQAILHKLKVKKPRISKYHYLVEATRTHLYSEELVNLIVSKIEKIPGYIAGARRSYRNWLKRRRTKREPREGNSP